MVNFKKLADRAKDVVEKRGGPEGLKSDANSLRDIAKSKGSLKDKAMAAKDALQETPGNEPRTPHEQGSQHRGDSGKRGQGSAATTAHEPSPEAQERHSGGPTGTKP